MSFHNDNVRHQTLRLRRVLQFGNLPEWRIGVVMGTKSGRSDWGVGMMPGSRRYRRALSSSAGRRAAKEKS